MDVGTDFSWQVTHLKFLWFLLGNHQLLLLLSGFNGENVHERYIVYCLSVHARS